MNKLKDNFQKKFSDKQFVNKKNFSGISTNVKFHNELMHIRSSAAACLNVFGYLNQNPNDIIPFFKQIGLDIQKVINFPSNVNYGDEIYDDAGPIVFEWIGPKESPINERKGGGRGYIRTSADAYMIARINDKITQLLIEWKSVILENLYNCDVFIPMITENFKTSDWTSQEIGIVLGRRENILIVPLKKDNYIPYGFISNFQAKDINTERVELEIIKKIENKYPKSLIKGLLNYLYKSRSFRDAEFRLDFVLQCIGETMDKDVLNKILEVALKNENSQILYAAKCKEWLIEQLKNNTDVDKEIFNHFKSLSEYEDEL